MAHLQYKGPTTGLTNLENSQKVIVRQRYGDATMPPLSYLSSALQTLVCAFLLSACCAQNSTNSIASLDGTPSTGLASPTNTQSSRIQDPLLAPASLGAVTQVTAGSASSEVESTQAVDRSKLQEALRSYGSCQSECATEITKKIWDEGIELALDAIAATEEKNPKIARVMWVGFAARACTKGEKIVNQHRVCANQ